ncbi:MAG: histidine kinase, partial [Fulvivirga sp.]
RLSHLMRYMLYSNSDNKITMGNEIEFLNSYMEIQKLRFGELDITTTIDVINPEIRIVPMLLIPLLENAYKHGTGTVEEPQIKIVLATSSSGVLQFTVTNRFNIASNASTEPKGIGLQNVRKRLGYLYEDKHELTILEDDDVFTTNLTLKL